jgi:hypothetical protein
MIADAELTLRASSGHPRVDAALRGLIGIFEAVFAGRIRAYYVEGSYADQTAVATSDIDLVIVFKGSFADQHELSAARRLGMCCADLSTYELDLDIIDEAQASRGVFPTLKLASNLLYGQDTREHMSLPPIEQWARDRMHATYWLIIKIFNRPGVVDYPVDYPRPHEEFFGYCQRTMQLPDGSEIPCTRDLIRATGWAATALIALKAGAFVARKRDCHRMYQQLIGDEWSELISDIYEQCKISWNYGIPTEPQARQQLRAICARTLEFENHFLALFKQFVLGELRGVDPKARCEAARLLEQIPYDDDTIREALFYACD